MAFQQTFQALSDPTRREILTLLKRGPLAAGDIVAHFDSSGATISHHLSVLQQAGLVDASRRGKFIYYELNLSVLEELMAWIAALQGGTSS